MFIKNDSTVSFAWLCLNQNDNYEKTSYVDQYKESNALK